MPCAARRCRAPPPPGAAAPRPRRARRRPRRAPKLGRMGLRVAHPVGAAHGDLDARLQARRAGPRTAPSSRWRVLKSCSRRQAAAVLVRHDAALRDGEQRVMRLVVVRAWRRTARSRRRAAGRCGRRARSARPRSAAPRRGRGAGSRHRADRRRRRFRMSRRACGQILPAAERAARCRAGPVRPARERDQTLAMRREPRRRDASAHRRAARRNRPGSTSRIRLP